MNAITELSKQSLKASKLKSIIIIIVITICTFLLTSINIISYGIKQTQLEQVTSMQGAYYGMASEVTETQIDKIRNHSQVKEVGVEFDLGSFKDMDTTFECKYLDDIAGEFQNIKMVSGTYPKVNNDVAIEEDYATANKLKLGDKIKNSANEELSICGIIEKRQSHREESSSLLLLSKAYADTKTDKFNALFTTKSKYDISNTVFKIGRDLSIDKNMSANTEYIRLDSFDFSGLLPYILLDAIVIFTSIITIYSIINISIADRVQSMGLLSCIGFTSKQIRKMIRLEGLILAFIGIPLGILISLICYFVFFPLISGSQPNISGFSIYTIPVSMAVSLITIYLAMMKPARYASKISPIDAVKAATLKNNLKKLPKSKKNILWDLANLNFKSIKKKTYITILSIAFSSMLFIIITVVINSVSLENYVRYEKMSNDFQIGISAKATNESSALIEKINSLEGIQDSFTVKKLFGILKIRIHKDNFAILDSGLLGCDDSYFEKLKKNLVAGEINLSKLKNENAVVISSKDPNFANYKIGDTIGIGAKMPNFVNQSPEEVDKVFKAFTVIGIVSDDELAGMGGNMRVLIHRDNPQSNVINDETYKNVDPYDTYLLINSKTGEQNQLNTSIVNLIKDNKGIKLSTFDEIYSSVIKDKQNIERISYSLILIISLIGILNFINTLVTQIINRKKELGLLRAVGMTDKQIKSMLLKEGFYYIGVSAVISIISGNVFAYIIDYFLKKQIPYIKYSFPVLQTILLVVITFIIQYMIVTLALKKVLRVNIVEQIKSYD